ncbi:copper homeostasis protein CutC [Oryzibacter oryziterrae]|uniref:copper homeostasis protein CutC n=1 Tax=Oryzibacter oryziterrae TaxID=2766474 RepID=UPI001F4480A0|nr:copper homeostasis protein CutC [Oryzibacter oryziterrae]
MTKPLIEVCVEGIDGLMAAEAAGADRVELCASLMEGGLTPSMGTIKTALERAKIPFYPIIRPRGGDFLYSDLEFRTMLADVIACREIGIKGVVFGCLTPDARYDEARMSALVQAAGPMSTTSHRAFDMTRDLGEAVEALVRCKVERVLTSGQRDSALEGLENLKTTVQLAAGRVKVMACGGLTPDNIVKVRDYSGAPELHFASLAKVQSGMVWHNPHVGMGSTDKAREYELTITDQALVAATIAAARS